eukprot:gene16579-biopygen13602
MMHFRIHSVSRCQGIWPGISVQSVPEISVSLRWQSWRQIWRQQWRWRQRWRWRHRSVAKVALKSNGAGGINGAGGKAGGINGAGGMAAKWRH